MRPLPSVLLSVVALVAAGCVTVPSVEPSNVADDVVPDLAAVFEMEHDHADPASHALAWNLDLVGHLAPELDGLDHVSIGELDVLDDDHVLAHVLGANGGFLILDVRDPAAPSVVSFTPAPADASCVGDVKAGPGPHRVVIGTQCSSSPGAGYGFVVYDVTDRAAPVMVGKLAPGAGCHMVDVAVVGGESYVYCADVTGPNVYRLVDGPLGVTALLVNPNAPREPGAVVHAPHAHEEFGPFGAFFVTSAHDMTAQEDPITGDPIVVASHSFSGVRVLDGRDPTLGTVLGTWTGQGADGYSWIHTAQAVELDGKRIVVAVTENVVDTPPRLWVLDWTDWANPVVLSEYHLAGQDNSHQLVFSLHNFQVVGSKLYVAAYHAGVWVIDLADPEHPVPVGFALPANDSPYAPAEGSFWGIGNDWLVQAWDVVVKDGHVLVGDMRSGFYAYAFHADPVGDAAYDSFG